MELLIAMLIVVIINLHIKDLFQIRKLNKKEKSLFRIKERAYFIGH